MKLLDLFCGAGGAGMGYHLAGFEVTGVDIRPQKNYPFEFIQADAMTFPLDGFDLVHASPPCQDHMRTRNKVHGTGWLLRATRERLIQNGRPWVIENVPGADMTPDYVLCGCFFGLPGLRRERWFETSWGPTGLTPPHLHDGQWVTVTGHDDTSWYRKKYGRTSREQRQAAMGIDWMTQAEMAESIPPEFTKYLAEEFLSSCLSRS